TKSFPFLLTFNQFGARIYNDKRYIARENMNAPNHQSAQPISEPVFYILLSLAVGRKHGYAILKDVEWLSQESVLLSTSTLYGALGRLEARGYVERVPADGEPAPGLPRKVYALTPQGRDLLHAEARRVQRLADLARRHRIGGPA
ncbi:MAG: PadR family transcriptional regulator, partial [Anaerolineales bacterium]